MAELLTTDRAAELLAMPKRMLNPAEFSWHYTQPPTGAALAAGTGKRTRGSNARQLHVRLIELGGRQKFLLSGTSNGSFSFTLKWSDFDLARIDTGYKHRNPTPSGAPREFIYGAHVHYYVAGHSLDFAYESAEYSQEDVNGALAFFLRHCNVVDAPDLQEMLRL